MTETRYYLELRVEGPRAEPEPREAVSLRRLARTEPAQARWLYSSVGGPWTWVDRAPWSDPQWVEHLSRPEIELWQLSAAEGPAGYFELRFEAAGRVEVAALGLVPQFIGRGLGAYLLSLAVHRASAMDGNVIWLHTSSRDHPHALINYQARGFRITKKEVL
jgi:ribosomal protein S18 acetylase RimI-like enzyme